MNHALRNATLEPYSAKAEVGGIRYFQGVPLEVLQMLIDLHFVETEPWNGCGGVIELFLPFLKRNRGFSHYCRRR